MYKYCTSDNYYTSTSSYRMKILMQVQGVWFCPLSLKSEQHLFSPNNIITSSREKVMRINKIITSGKIHVLWSFIKFSQLILEGSVWRSVWRVCIWILEHWAIKLIQWSHFVHCIHQEQELSSMCGMLVCQNCSWWTWICKLDLADIRDLIFWGFLW